MNNEGLAIVLCRLVGLYFMLTAIYGVGYALITFATPMLFGDASQFTIRFALNMSLQHLLYLLIGLIVWRKAPAIGAKMAQ